MFEPQEGVHTQPEESAVFINKPGYLSVDPIKVLWQAKYEIAGLVLLAAIIGLFAVYSVKPVYRATTSLLIQPNNPNIVKIEEVQQREGPALEVLNTEFEILRSRRLAEMVIDELSLESHPEYQVEEEKEAPGKASWLESVLNVDLDWLVDLLPFASQGEEVEEGTTSHRQQIVDKLRKQITVEAIYYSYIVKIHVDTTYPELSADIANTLVKRYIQQSFSSREAITTEASGWLTGRLAEIKEKLTKSEQELQKFYETEGLINIGGARELLESELSDNSRRLREARKKKSELSNLYQKVKSANGNTAALEEIAVSQQGDLVESTKKAYLTAQEDLGSLRSRYGAKHPKIIEAEARVKEAKDAYFAQLRLTAQGVSSEYEIALETEKDLAAAVDQSRAKIQNLDRNQYRLELLERELETNRRLFETFLVRFKETDISRDMDVGNLKIIDKAEVPTSVFAPNKVKWLAISLAIGAFLGLFAAFLREFLDNTVKSAEDIEHMGNVHVLSMLPLVKGMEKKSQTMARLEMDEPMSAFSESVRTLRTSLMLTDSSGKKKTILVASSVPEEGKTSIAVNLAIACSQVERVLLLDADLRRPSIGKYLALPEAEGNLVDVLAGRKTIDESIVQLPNSKLHVLPCHHVPPSPAEIIGSARFVQFLRTLAEKYDRIIIDSAPCQVVSDALILSRMADHTIFLVRANSTNKRVVRKALERLHRSGAKILGVVLNQVELSNRHQYGDYYYYQEYAGKYGSGYGRKRAEA